MKLSELEAELKIRFPEKWHQIYHSGTSDWLELTAGQFQTDRIAVMSNPKSFLMMNGCEPLLFEKIPERLQELQVHWISAWKKYRNLVLKPNLRLIPFAQTAGGDNYCFLYRDGIPEPEIVICWHDEPEPQMFGRNFDEFLYLNLLDDAQIAEDIDGYFQSEVWNEQKNYLNPEFRKKLDSIPEEDLPFAIQDCIFPHADIWESEE